MLSMVCTRFGFVRASTVDMVRTSAVRTDMFVEAVFCRGGTDTVIPPQTGICRSLYGSPSGVRLRLRPRVCTSDIEELYSQVAKLGEVCKQEVSVQGNLFVYGLVIIENESVVFFCEHGEQVKNVPAVFLAFLAPMWESKGCCRCRLVPGDEPISGCFDCF